MTMRCSSCGANILSKKTYVKMKCPNCDKVEIIRCYNCKSISNKYTCQSCGFIGP